MTNDDRTLGTAPLTEVRDNLSEFIDEVVKNGSDLVITRHGRPTAVVVGYDEYEALLETLNILSDTETMSAIAEAEDDLVNGRLSGLD